MYQRLRAIAQLINLIALVLGLLLITLVLILTLNASSEQQASSSKGPSHLETFGYILSLGPLLLISSLCGLNASQKELPSSSNLIVCWIAAICTVSMAFWIAFEHLNLSSFSSSVALSFSTVILSCLQLLSLSFVTFVCFQNFSRAKNSTPQGVNVEVPLQMVSLSSDSSSKTKDIALEVL